MMNKKRETEAEEKARVKAARERHKKYLMDMAPGAVSEKSAEDEIDRW